MVHAIKCVKRILQVLHTCTRGQSEAQCIAIFSLKQHGLRSEHTDEGRKPYSASPFGDSWQGKGKLSCALQNGAGRASRHGNLDRPQHECASVAGKEDAQHVDPGHKHNPRIAPYVLHRAKMHPKTKAPWREERAGKQADFACTTLQVTAPADAAEAPASNAAPAASKDTAQPASVRTPEFLVPIEPEFDAWLNAQLAASPADPKDTDEFRYITFSELPPFTDKHKSLMRKTLTPELWARYKDLKSSKGYTLSNAIQAGVVRPHLSVGITCGDEECFELFKDIIYPVVQGWHKFDPYTQVQQGRVPGFECSCLSIPLLPCLVQSSALLCDSVSFPPCCCRHTSLTWTPPSWFSARSRWTGSPSTSSPRASVQRAILLASPCLLGPAVKTVWVWSLS